MARAAKKEKEVSLETVLWNCRVALRGVGSTEKNRDAVIGLVLANGALSTQSCGEGEIRQKLGNRAWNLKK